jgi:hypothetical protein
MKLRKNNLIGSLTILFFLFSFCKAQETTEIKIEKDGKTIPITDATIREDGRRVLVIEKNESVRLTLEKDVEIESSDAKSVVVLDRSILKGVAENTEAVIMVKKAGKAIDITGVLKLVVQVVEVDATRQIVAQSTFLPYKTVKDNFGKKFAQSYFVVQVDIRNEKLNKQFIVQTLDLVIDPNQCLNGRFIYANFDDATCTAIFNEYFIFPSTQQSVRGEEVIGTAKADFGRSNRNLGFRALSFTASLGTVLTGFKGLIGTDGILGINVLGTTVTDAAKALIPDTSAEKLENLKKAVMTEDVIISSKSSKTFNIFIPTDQIFFSDSWDEYIKPARDSDKSAYKLKKILKLLLLASATGVLVDNDAPKVKVQSDDAFPRVKDKFNIVSEFSEDVQKRTKKAKDTREDLRVKWNTPATRNQAEKSLRNIVKELQSDNFFKGFFAAEDLSDGNKIADSLLKLSRILFADNTNDRSALIKKLEETIILNQF